jgi:multiple sugar transport system substrate-binding protein
MIASMMLAACAPAPTAAPAAPAAPAATTAPAAGGAKPDLSITWFEWPPCDNLAKLVATYPDATVKVNCVPLDSWHDQIFQGYIGKAGADLPIGDSQWTGEEVKGGDILDLTDWMKTNTPMSDYVPSALSAYGEYPPNSGHYYGAPIMADVQLLVYNKTLLDQYKLTVPTTWNDLLTGAQAIKKDGKYSGFVSFWNGNSDTVQSFVNQLTWSWGGDLWDPATYKFDGVINSPTAVDALTFAANLEATGPTGSGSWGYNEVIDAMCNGKAAMTTIWTGFGGSFTDPKTCKSAGDLAFAIPPAGPKAHVLQLGGMGIAISAYTKNKDASFAFLKWLESTDTQTKWAGLGGYSAEKTVLASDTFLKAQPYNPMFAQAFQLVKDFYNIPEYAALLTIQGKYENLAVSGQMAPKDASDAMAKEMQAVIDQAYPNGPPK